MKKIFFFASLVLGFIALFASVSNKSKVNEITLANLLAISSVQAEGTGNTGPASYHDCAGIGTGTYKECDCNNDKDCTPHSCQ